MRFISVDTTVRLRFVFEDKDKDIAQTKAHEEIERMLKKSKLEKHVVRFTVCKPERAIYLKELTQKGEVKNGLVSFFKNTIRRKK